MSKAVSERTLVFLIAAVQLVNIVDFMMVMPLGPFFAEAINISRSHLGWVGGSYTAAAGIAGLVGSIFLDRFDRRKALAVSMLGLVAGTIAGGFATNLETLLAARILAGSFGGPATSLSFAIIADLIPPERRGRAMGAVMGAFSVSSVVGVPASLELARIAGWRAPFFAVGALGFLVAMGAVALLPPVRGHIRAPRQSAPKPKLLRPDVLFSYAMTAVAMMGGFILIPNFPSYILGNLGFPADRYWMLYASGGVASLIVLRIAGRWVDRWGSFPVAVVGSAILIVVLAYGFVIAPTTTPVLPLFIGFMTGMSIRNVAYNTLTSKVPGHQERSRFMSMQSAVQHFASALGAFLSSWLLTEGRDGHLVGIPRLALISIALTVALLPLLRWVEGRVRQRPPGLQPAQPGLPSTHSRSSDQQTT